MTKYSTLYFFHFFLVLLSPISPKPFLIPTFHTPQFFYHGDGVCYSFLRCKYTKYFCSHAVFLHRASITAFLRPSLIPHILWPYSLASSGKKLSFLHPLLYPLIFFQQVVYSVFAEDTALEVGR